MKHSGEGKVWASCGGGCEEEEVKSENRRRRNNLRQGKER